MIVLRDAGGLGDVLRIFAVLDALAERGPVTFYTDACYRDLVSLCASVAGGACVARFWRPAPARSPTADIQRWGQATMSYADRAAHDPDEPVIDLFCPALLHEAVKRGAPTLDRVECWAAAAGLENPGKGSVRLEVPPAFREEARRWASSIGGVPVAISPASNASIRTWRNGLQEGRRTGMVGALVHALRRAGMTPVVFESATLGYEFESISHDVRTQAARIAACAAFVGPDSGMLHVACAQGVPSVALFGPTDPRLVLAPYAGRIVALQGRWGPRVVREIGCTRPCYGFLSGGFRRERCGSSCAVLEGIALASVVDAVESLVRKKVSLPLRRLDPRA